MASELSPHERDVLLRLRLGLDDGITRTTREIIEICGGNLSISEVRMTEQRAYKKLRAPYSVANYQLSAFLGFAGIDQIQHDTAEYENESIKHIFICKH
jgi:DNA-directed RNA polymerase sigma subunit (sigma70/sigma32)